MISKPDKDITRKKLQGTICVGESHQEDVTTSLTHKLDPSILEPARPSPVFGMCAPFAFPAPRCCFQNTALRKKCGVETIWTGYDSPQLRPAVSVTDPRQGLYINF